jgi:hypothetical protein
MLKRLPVTASQHIVTGKNTIQDTVLSFICFRRFQALQAQMGR